MTLPTLLLLAFLALLVTSLGVGALLWCERPGSPDPELASWRLVVSREARFSPAQAAVWFASLAPLFTSSGPRPLLELRGEGRQVQLRLQFPVAWEGEVRSRLAAWFPGARLEPLSPKLVPRNSTEVTLALRQAHPALYPLRLAAPTDTDPLLGVYGQLSQAEQPLGLRLRWGLEPHDWGRWAPAALAALQGGRPLPPRGWTFQLSRFLTTLYPPAGTTHRSPGARSHAPSSELLAKVREPVFSATLEIFAQEQDPAVGARRCQELAAHFETGYRHPEGNALVPVGDSLFPGWLAMSHSKSPELTLSASELAALFHLPAADHPLVATEHSRRVAPRPVLPPTNEAEREANPLACLGEALYPERATPFGLRSTERRQHLYVVGKTGAGKSTLLATLLRQDLEAGRGVGLIDPHGDLAERALALVPPERRGEVLYFHPADLDFPVGFNPLAVRSRVERPLAASGIIYAFKKLFGESWGPRLEYFLRNAVLALLETPNPSLLLLPRLLTDAPFRALTLQHVHDPLLRSFFLEEYERYEPRWRMEAISPILNKVGQFLSAPVVRHVVGQSGPGFDLRALMDRRGIFIANLASGRIGEDNTALLGALLVSGFQLAAMSRATLPEEERQDFFLAVDEFQHFATEAFASVLSEARKYRLALTLSHQYLDQLPPGISDAVFGNVGSLGVFRVGGGDQARLARELAPSFDGQDLGHLPNHQFCARILHGGEILPAFSARTIPLPPLDRDVMPLIAESRRRWARPRAEVELEIADRWEGRGE